MQLRRFTAENISKALEMVKAELGNDAVILSTEKKRKKDSESRNFISYTEVVAAVDRQEGLIQGSKAVSQVLKKKQDPEEKRDRTLAELSNEVHDIKKALSRMSMLLARALKKREHQPPSGSLRASCPPECPSEIGAALSCLRLDPETRNNLSSRILSSFSCHPITEDQVISWLKNYILAHFRPGPRAEDSSGPLWWAFIGPTGVGKTTTLAKIAARLKFLKKRTGVLVSVDSYRLGAIDQLRKYARLMELPLETARTNKDLLRIFSRHREKDFILLDTTGRNPFSSSHRTELQRIFDAIPGLMAQVMLCSPYKREDLMESINFYRIFPTAGWTLTKTDETRSLAASVFPVLQAELPVSYMTTGQKVPEDIEVPSGRKLCRELLVPSQIDTGTGRDSLTHLNATVC